TRHRKHPHATSDHRLGHVVGRRAGPAGAAGAAGACGDLVWIPAALPGRDRLLLVVLAALAAAAENREPTNDQRPMTNDHRPRRTKHKEQRTKSGERRYYGLRTTDDRQIMHHATRITFDHRRLSIVGAVSPS